MGSTLTKSTQKHSRDCRVRCLVIAGGEDTGATQVAVIFLSSMKGETARRNIHLSGCGRRLRATTLQRRKELQSRSRPYQLGPGPGFSCHSFGALTLGRRKGHRTGLLEILENRGDYRTASVFLKMFHHHVCPRHREDWLHPGTLPLPDQEDESRRNSIGVAAIGKC